MQEAGIDSGMTQSATVASGLQGRGKKHQQITVISTVQVLWPIVLDMILLCILFTCVVMDTL
jgi:TRAP-type uncharacterized transport system substrate-binding protein